MAECQFLEACPFFNDKMADSQNTAELFKNRYCKQQPETCARLMVRNKIGKEKVPADLYPN